MVGDEASPKLEGEIDEFEISGVLGDKTVLLVPFRPIGDCNPRGSWLSESSPSLDEEGSGEVANRTVFVTAAEAAVVEGAAISLSLSDTGIASSLSITGMVIPSCERFNSAAISDIEVLPLSSLDLSSDTCTDVAVPVFEVKIVENVFSSFFSLDNEDEDDGSSNSSS